MSDYKPPSIPPIQNIKDAPTKNALLALTEGWQVRNGMTGSGANRFITKAEFDLALKNLSVPQAAAQQEVPGTYAVGGSSSSSSGGADLLPLNNTWRGLNIWERPTPANTTADNWHFKFSRDGAARFAFSLGHANSDDSYLDANNDTFATESIGNLYLVDPGRLNDAGGNIATFYKPTKGGGMRLFGRLSFDETRLNSVMIRLRDTQKIGWGVSGNAAHQGIPLITTFFDPTTSVWKLQNSSLDRFMIDVRRNQLDCIRISGTSSASTYLGDNMTINAVYANPGQVPGVGIGVWQKNLSATSRVSLQSIISDLASTSVDHGTVLNPEAKYGSLNGIAWNTTPASRYTLQQFIENIVTTSVDHGASINNIRALTGDGFTTLPKNALMLKLEAGSAAVANSTSNHALSWNTNTSYPVQLMLDNLAFQSEDWRANFLDIRNLTGFYNPDAPGTNFALKLSQISITVGRLNGVYVGGSSRTIESAFSYLETSLGNLWTIVNGMTKP